jgi:hypothetical protein
MIALYHTAVNYITPYLTTQNAYHLGAFVLAGAGAQYAVQLIKILGKNKYGKTALRFFNGSFATIITAVGGIASGGIALGQLTITSAALASFSVIIYRLHNSFLYKSAQADVTSALDGRPLIPTPPKPKVTDVPLSSFAND